VVRQERAGQVGPGDGTVLDHATRARAGAARRSAWPSFRWLSTRKFGLRPGKVRRASRASRAKPSFPLRSWPARPAAGLRDGYRAL